MRGFIVLILVLLLCSCTEQNELCALKFINVESALQDPYPIPISRFSDSINYIVLSTSDSSLLVGVAMFSFMNNQMLVSDYQNCMKFTERGEFLGKIGSKGRGPGEYKTMLSIDLGNDGVTYFHDIRELIEFSPGNSFVGKFDFLREIPVETLPGRVKLVYDSLFFVHIRNDAGDQQYKAIITNKNGAIKKSFRNFQFFTPPLRGHYFSLCAEADVYQIGENYGYKSIFNDTIFYFDNRFELIPQYYFSYGKYGRTFLEFIDGSRINAEFQYARKIFETKQYIFFHLSGNLRYKIRESPVELIPGYASDKYPGGLLGVYTKETGLTEIVSIADKMSNSIIEAGLFNDIDGGPRFLPQFMMDENRLIMAIRAQELKNYVASASFRNASAKYPEKKKALEVLANNLSEDDNPVLMVVTFR